MQVRDTRPLSRLVLHHKVFVQTNLADYGSQRNVSQTNDKCIIHSTSMTSTTMLEPAGTKTVNTTLNFYLDPSKGGHTSYQIGVADYYRRKFDPHPVQIQEIRGREAEFDLETHGFQHHKHTSAEKD